MTIVEPLPAGGYGKANWTDYSNYWREGDAEWLMERTTLRYASTAARTADWPTPKFGHVTYNEVTDRLEVWSKTQTSWVALPQWANLVSTQDTPTNVSISHKTASGKGITFQPAQTIMDNPILVMGGVLYVDSTGVSVKTGAKTVKLTTDATSLVVDSPISAAGLASSGTLTGVSATLTGSLTVPNITMSGTLNGGTFAGAVNGTTVNASTGGTIGTVGMSGGVVTAPSGVISSGAYLRGDANMGYLSHRAAGGAVSAPTLTVDGTYIRVRANNGIPWDRHDASFTGGWVACVFTSDPGAANAPTGSILLT